MFFKSIKFKLTLSYIAMVCVFTIASLVLVTDTAQRTSYDELVKKGNLLSDVATKTAANRTSRLWSELNKNFTELGSETLFMAAVDKKGVIRAHTLDFLEGRRFRPLEGKVIHIGRDGATLRRVIRAGVANYEFKRTLLIGDRKAGDIYIALDAYPIKRAKLKVRNRILLMSALSLALGIPGILYISHRFTTPLKWLAEGIRMLPTAANMDEIKAFSKDETGELIEKFNSMSRTILEQKQELRQNATELEESYVATLRLLATVIDAKDKYTRGHSTRVARMSTMLGQRLDLNEMELKDLEISSMFHDVGKIKTPDRILNKVNPLDPEEGKEMMMHTVYGAEILGVVQSLHKHIPAALYHHEWYNGKGYPHGLRGDQIPMPAAIIAIVDAYDAMTTSRPYRAGMSHDEAVEELMQYRGTQFHPEITDKFLDLLKDNMLSNLEAFSQDEASTG